MGLEASLEELFMTKKDAEKKSQYQQLRVEAGGLDR